MTPEKLSEALLERQLLSPDELGAVIEAQQRMGGPLSKHVMESGYMTEEAFRDFLSSVYGVKAIDLSTIEIEQDVIRLVSEDIATRFHLLPISRQGRTLVVAMCNPDNLFAIDDLKFYTGLEISPVVVPDNEVKEAIDKYYDQAETLASVMEDLDENIEFVDDEEEMLKTQQMEEESESAPVVKLVNSLLADAVTRGASDIHIEPFEKEMRVRYRIDGVLQEMMHPPVRLKRAIISRLKIMAELNIAERRIPQDGRIKLRLGKKTVDMRVSSLPTMFDEKIVMRILDQENLEVNLEKLGFQEEPLANFMEAIHCPYGMVLVTGPTGSGKTTTLYSALTKINTTSVNIITTEDPVEYNLPGINQVQVNDEVGLSFAAALKSILRQDPNIVMVGEIRDLETASIATKAALTGHLVLSTLHTNDAPSSIGRLVDMGIEPFLISSSVQMILAQRLVRRICTRCKEEIKISPDILVDAGIKREEAENLTLYKGAGCPNCNKSGYSGRVGLYEVMVVSPSVREMILDRASTAEIKDKAVAEGMITLRQDALWKMKQGSTTLEEVLRETSQD
ncbi:MAG: type IV-A pilus assembly ATPase PilB [bacterium]|nr:type IV-A pilus assembly ATPase PilB [bacterium]